MSVAELPVSDFLDFQKAHQIPLIDSRSEGEYEQAHIPHAHNISLLNNDARKIVGTIYKKEGKEAAVLKGFELVGPRFYEIIKSAISLNPKREVMLYCWRGGMRSNIMAWLLSMNGFTVCLLKGGYKAYRNHAIQTNSKKYNFIVLGGPTGSGKTEMLHKLAEAGEQVIDLEALANHKGSAFGGIGLPPQPSCEQFENLIAECLSQFDPDKRVWIENESRTIGSCILPEEIYNAIRTCTLINVDVGHMNRVNRITNEYGKIPFEILAATTEKIKKRLGPQHVKEALLHLQNNDFGKWLEILLTYYDKLYEYGNSLRKEDAVFHLDLTFVNDSEIANTILEFTSSINKPLNKITTI